MFAWVRHRLRDDEGISLVEVLVSIMLVGLILAALGSTLTTSMASARQSEGLTHANALANQEFERLQGLEWPKLGLSSAAANYTSTAVFGSLTLHTVSNGTAPNDGLVLPATVTPVQTVTRAGRVYTIRRAVVWRCNQAAETSPSGCPANQPRYKQYRVQVDWTEGTANRTIRLVGKRTVGTGGVGGGGSLDLSDGNLYRIVSFTVTPDPVYVQANGRLVASATNLCSTNPPSPGCGPPLGGAALQIDVETTHASSGVTVHWGGTPVAMTQVADSDGLRWTHQLPPSGSGPGFAPHGLLEFSATATQAGTGVTHSDTTAAYLVYPIAVTSPTTTLWWDTNASRFYTGTAAESADRICVFNNTRLLRNDHPYSIDIRGVNDDDWVRLSRLDGSTWTYDMAATSIAASTTFQVVLTPAMAAAFTGQSSTTFRFDWTRSVDGATGSFNLPMAVRVVGNGNTTVC